MRSIVIVCAAATVAQAQPDQVTTDVEVPTIVIDSGETANGPSEDEALDLANIVQSAAKGVTTVQEAPAIVTVVTADEIKDRGFQDLTQLYDTVPGWTRVGLLHDTFHTPMVRGQAQAVQFLHDGVSLFDPFVNVPAATRMQPMEIVKRVEMITGPGGVLWGSNSLLGILNIITKEAEDVDGVEVGGEVGSGDGDRRMGRAYVMVGKSDLMHGKLKFFGHASVETYQGDAATLPLLLYHGALPQPNSANVYGPLTVTDQPQSLLASFDAKVTWNTKLTLRVSAPLSRKYNPAGLSGNPNREDLPEDAMCGGANPAGDCVDPLRTSRKNREDVFDRYAVLEYRTRFLKDKAGVTMRGYGIQFVRGFEPLQVLAPSVAVPGGLAFAADLTSYRAGGALDGDVELSRKLRLLYGAEAFREWKPDAGTGTDSELLAPYNLEAVPLLCPRIFDPAQAKIVPLENCPLTFAFPADRTVLGAYVDPQLRPSKTLIFDAGARVQVAPPSLGVISYDPSITLAASMVWRFIPNWHLKLNYTQGFRPPVFNNTTSNGEGVQIGGNPNLVVETSDAAQAEVNARVWKGQRRIRELSFRIDGSYTRLNNLIQVAAGNYNNSGERGIASGELLAKLYVQGGHRLELGYTYLQIDTTDKGRLRTIPENWFDLATVFQIAKGLTGTTRLKVTGATEDANRLVDYRGTTYGPDGVVMSPVTVAPTDVVMDRLPPIAELSAGLSYSPTKQLMVRASVYNALVSHSYQPDVFSDYEPHLEYLPNPYEGFRAYLSALYAY